jgi:thioredoxin 1
MKFSFLGLMVLLVLGACSSRNQSDDAALNNTKTNGIKNLVYANDMNTFNELIKSDVPVLVDFYADWCAPCRMMSPILEQVAHNMDKEVKVIKVNVDKNKQAAAKYSVRSIPTLILFHKGEVIWQGVGVIQADQIEQIIRSKSSVANN